jgi:hypothetical protein
MGIQEGLGNLTRLIIVDVAFDMSDEFIDGHVSILKRSGADIFVFAGVSATASHVIRLGGGDPLEPSLPSERCGCIDRHRVEPGWY